MIATARRSDVAIGWRIVDTLIALRRRLRLQRLSPGIPYLLLIPGVLFVSILAFGLLDLLWFSVHSFDPFLRKQGALSLQQYRRLSTGLDGSYYRGILFSTLWISTLVTVSAVALAVPVSYFIVRTGRRSFRLMTLNLILVPFLMGEIVRAFGWLLLLGRRGALAWGLSWVGVKDLRVLGTRFAVWIGMIQVMMPIAALVLLPAMKRINPDLERAAQTLGAPPRKVWRHVVIPLVRPGAVAAAAAVFSLSMTEYAIPQVLGLGHVPFVANTIQNIYFLQNNLYLGSAYAMILVGTVTVFVLALLRLGRGWAVDR